MPLPEVPLSRVINRVFQQPVNEILDGSSKAAKGRITHRTPQLEELIAEVERWFQEEDSKTHE
jgi:hypothetical protein